ncbi:MMPL family transporter [Streptacidiphilus sp. PAMC 29251]
MRSRYVVPLVLLLVWLGLGAAFGPYAGKLGEVATNDSSAFLPKSAESTQVAALQKSFQGQSVLPVIVVWQTDRGAAVSADQRSAAAAALQQAAKVPGAVGAASPVLAAKDGRALEGVVQLRADLGDKVKDSVDAVRAKVSAVPGTQVGLAGPAALQNDLSGAFAGIDGLLLLVALAVVLVILLAVYRSVLLPLLVILGAVFALGVACAIVYVLARHGIVRVDGQVQGILSILVIGAATDYGLLMSARFREELQRHGDRFTAMRIAWRQSVQPIAASGSTVALSLLVLLLSDLTNNQALGPVGAIGVVCAVLSALTFLPAALVLCGRAAFWPARPKADGTGAVHGVWSRVAALVGRRPRLVWGCGLILLAGLAAFAPTLDSGGVPQSQLFTTTQPSVTAQKLLAAHFPGGSGNPAVVIAEADSADRVGAAAKGVHGVSSVTSFTGAAPGGPAKVVDGRVQLQVTLTDTADSDAAVDTVKALRSAVHAVPGAQAEVGGFTAQQYDTRHTAEHDRTVIVPVVLLCVLIILILLLRALIAPLLLVLSVALSYLATLGVAAIVFPHILGFSATDPSVPLYGFIFLVALGVDYNIFLMTRVREETLPHGTRDGVLRGLTATGGVITSAGVVLAATFAALGVIPLAFLAQIAFIVAFGVLLDTLLVRSLVVPGLVYDLDDRVWWPSALARRKADGDLGRRGGGVRVGGSDGSRGTRA